MALKACLCLSLFGSANLLADYSQHPAAGAVVDKLVKEYAFSRDEALAVLRQAEPESRILDSMANAAEKTKTWTAYRKSFLVETRVREGRKFLSRHAEQLRRVEQQYGVPAEIIVAILGVETNYGGYTGKANVLNALATLAFEHPRRGAFFSSELTEYIVLAREKGWDYAASRGSYAGAMGMSQFMPSNYRRLAVDGNGDGVVDLFDSDDAIASIAHYFVHHGWKPGEGVATLLQAGADFDESLIDSGLKTNTTVGRILESGYRYQRDDIAPFKSSMPARITRFNDDDGDEFWLTTHNFYVISRYNPRSKYAMAVYLLSQAIASDT